MTFDSWWKNQDARFKSAMLKADMREVWYAAEKVEREACAKVC